MSFQHDQQAHAATARLLHELQTSVAPWAASTAQRLTPSTTYWHGRIDWPKPDTAFQDATSGATLAIEFKPAGHGKGEYVRGLGQAFTYLQHFEYAALIVPERTIDDYPIAEYLRDIIQSGHLAQVPVALFQFTQDPARDLSSLVPLRLRPQQQRPKTIVGSDVFWAYWRSLSQYDLLDVLKLMDIGGQDFDAAYDAFWTTKLSTGGAKQWDGTPRRPYSPRSQGAYRINDKASVRHIGLVDSKGHLTAAGYHLLRIGKVYGPESTIYLREIARLLLREGRHLDLIFWIDEQQRAIQASSKTTRRTFAAELDARLHAAGIIPHLPPLRGKGNFIRDELTIWNKLGLLEEENGRYFTPGTGLVFNWRAIVSVVGE